MYKVVLSLCHSFHVEQGNPVSPSLYNRQLMRFFNTKPVFSFLMFLHSLSLSLIVHTYTIYIIASLLRYQGLKTPESTMAWAVAKQVHRQWQCILVQGRSSYEDSSSSALPSKSDNPSLLSCMNRANP